MNRVVKVAAGWADVKVGHRRRMSSSVEDYRSVPGRRIPEPVCPAVVLPFQTLGRGAEIGPTDKEPTVFLIDRDLRFRDVLDRLLRLVNLSMEHYATTRAFLEGHDACLAGCVISETRMPGIDGIDLLRWFRAEGSGIPVIFLTERASVPMAVQALREGAFHFLSKPIRKQVLLAHVQEAIALDLRNRRRVVEDKAAAAKLAVLSPREQEFLTAMIAGETDRMMAAHLGITMATLEFCRACIMTKIGARTVTDLVRFALRADWDHRTSGSAAGSHGR